MPERALEPQPLSCAASHHPSGIHAKKKRFIASERDTPENLKRREAFGRMVHAFKSDRLVFIDESFCKTGMRREHGWALKGHRLTGHRPCRNWKTVSIIGAIRLGHHPKIMTHPRPVNGATYLKFVKHRLAPWLRSGDLVIMDNLNIHKMELVKEAIRQAGGIPFYLPTYSPELNPIEKLWADIKRDLRRLAINDERELRVAVRRLRTGVSARKIAAWFRHSLREAAIK